MSGWDTYTIIYICIFIFIYLFICKHFFRTNGSEGDIFPPMNMALKRIRFIEDLSEMEDLRVQ